MNRKIRLFLSAMLLAQVLFLRCVDSRPCRPGVMMCNRKGKRFLLSKVGKTQSFLLVKTLVPRKATFGLLFRTHQSFKPRLSKSWVEVSNLLLIKKYFFKRFFSFSFDLDFLPFGLKAAFKNTCTVHSVFLY